MRITKFDLIFREDLPDPTEEELQVERDSKKGFEDVFKAINREFDRLSIIVNRLSIDERAHFESYTEMMVLEAFAGSTPRRSASIPLSDIMARHRPAFAPLQFNIDYASTEMRSLAIAANFGMTYGTNYNSTASEMRVYDYEADVGRGNQPSEPTRPRLDRSMYGNLPGLDRSNIRSRRPR